VQPHEVKLNSEPLWKESVGQTKQKLNTPQDFDVRAFSNEGVGINQNFRVEFEPGRDTPEVCQIPVVP
jgi:hypothetical protein